MKLGVVLLVAILCGHFSTRGGANSTTNLDFEGVFQQHLEVPDVSGGTKSTFGGGTQNTPEDSHPGDFGGTLKEGVQDGTATTCEGGTNGGPPLIGGYPKSGPFQGGFGDVREGHHRGDPEGYLNNTFEETEGGTHHPGDGPGYFEPHWFQRGYFKGHLERFQSYADTLRDFSEAHNTYVRLNNSEEPTEGDLDNDLDPNPRDNGLGTHYDFIVIGAGSSGTVIASRLSENPHWRVLLVEAGKPEGVLNQIPLPSIAKSIGTEYNWRYYLEPQPGIGRAYKKFHLARGKALGGSSSINYMVYSRGNPLDYEFWSKMGNPGWGYDEVLPYFLRSEQCHLGDVNGEYHNPHGMVSVERPYYSGLVQAFIEAGGEMGYEMYSDYNGPYQDGFSHVQATMIDGERHSVARAYLGSTINRPNLYVLTKAQVTRILIGPHSKRAYGVEYHHKGAFHVVYSHKEVVLSAGAINSPQLLMLSGVGPSEDLEKLGIPLVKDLPVGQTLRDHFIYPGLIFWYQKPLAYTAKDLFKLDTYSDYVKYRQGPLRSAVVDGIAFIRTNTTLERPDVELNLLEASGAGDFGFFAKTYLTMKPDYFLAYFAPYALLKTTSIVVGILHPKSKGCVKLKSKNPFEYPLIYGNYLSHRDDLKSMIGGIRFAVQMSKSAAFERYGIRMVERRVPGCTLYGYQTDEYWECAVRTFGYSLSHVFGSVKMGPSGDPESVVDHQLRVYGVGNLRVADASIFPGTTGSHPNAPAIMVGEKASDMIKEYWGDTSNSEK